MDNFVKIGFILFFYYVLFIDDMLFSKYEKINYEINLEIA